MQKALRHTALLLSAALAFGASRLVAQQGNSPTCGGRVTALVLSGGGAKGLAHVGVIAAMEAAGVRPTVVVGTSMGAMIGALYASGYRAAEIDSIARTLSARNLFGAAEVRGPTAWGGRLPLVLWEEGESGFQLKSSAIQQQELNAALNAAYLRGNVIARGDFDRLPIPLRVVATDLRDRSVVALAGGDLAQAVRASIAIPLVFAPQRIGDVILADGGLSANIPIGVARAQGATRVLVSDVSERPADSLDLESPLVVADRLLNWLFRQPPDSLGPDDVWIRPEVDGFRALDFSAPSVDSLIRLGRVAADSMIARWGCSPESAAGVRAPTRFLGLSGKGMDPSEALLVRRLLGLDGKEVLDEVALRERLEMIGEREIFNDLWLTPVGSGDTVTVEPRVRRLPRRSVGIGLSYDAELGGRVWGGLLDRNLPGLRVEGAAVLVLGRFEQELELTARRQTLLGRAAFSPVASLSLHSHDIRRFDDRGIELEPDDLRQATASLGVERFVGRLLRVTAVAEARWWRDVDLSSRAEVVGDAVGGRLVLETLGKDPGRGARLEAGWTKDFHWATGAAHGRREFGAIRLESALRLGIGQDIPVALSYPLGGEVGFPGLHLGERRGDREVFGSLALSRGVSGPLRVRLLGAVGRVAIGDLPISFAGSGNGGVVRGGLFGSGGWIFGARAGIGSDTPLGPVQVEYGWNDAGREALYLRVGRWF